MEVEEEREELLRGRDDADSNLGPVSQEENNNNTASSLKFSANGFAKLEVKAVDQVISSSTHGQTSSDRIVFFDNDTGGEFKHLFSDIGPNAVQGLIFEKDYGETGLLSTPMELDSHRMQRNDFNHQSLENHIDASNSELVVQASKKSSNGYSLNKSSPEITEAIDEGSIMKETDSEKTEYDFERVLEKQNTHDLYCPNCHSCITRRVILRKRKRTVLISEELETEVAPYVDVDPTEDQGGKALDNKRLATIEKVTIHEDGSSSAAKDSDRDDEPEMFRCLSCFSFFIPTGTGFRLFNLSRDKTEKENREKTHTISAPRKNWWHFMFHSDMVQNSETDTENLQKGDIGTSSEFSSPSDSSCVPAIKETNKTELHDGTSIVSYPAKTLGMLGKVIFSAGEKPDGAMDNGRAKEESNKTELHDGTSIVPYPAKSPEMIGNVTLNAGQKPDGAMNNGKGQLAMDHSLAQTGSNIVKHTGNVVPTHQQDGLKFWVDGSFNPISPLVVKEAEKGPDPNLEGHQGLDGKSDKKLSDTVMEERIFGDLPKKVVEVRLTNGSAIRDEKSLNKNSSNSKPDQDLRGTAMEENVFGDLHPKKQAVEARHNDGSTIGDEISLNKNNSNSKADQELRDAVMEENIFGDLLPKEQFVEVKHKDGSSIEDENSPNKNSTNSKPLRDAVMEGNIFGDLLLKEQFVEVKHKDGSSIEDKTSLNKNSTYSKPDPELRDTVIDENIFGDLPPKERVVEAMYNNGSAIEDEKSPNKNSTNFLHSGVAGYPVAGTKVDIHIEKPLTIDADLSISIHNSSLIPDKKVTGTSDLKVVLENKDAGGLDTVILIEDRPQHVALPSSQDVAEIGAVQQTRQTEARDISGLDIVKSIVYGGLIESITSLGIVSSSVGADAATLNIFALSIANLVGGVFMIIHNIWDLRAEHDANNTSIGVANTSIDGATSNLRTDRYLELLGCRENFWVQATVGVLSFIIFGMIPPVIYGFSFRKSDDRDFKLVAVATASMLCIALLASGKAYVQRQPAKGYVKTVVYYIIMGFMASGISYVAGDLIKKLLEKLGLFDSGEAALNMSIIQALPSEIVGSSSY